MSVKCEQGANIKNTDIFQTLTTVFLLFITLLLLNDLLPRLWQTNFCICFLISVSCCVRVINLCSEKKIFFCLFFGGFFCFEKINGKWTRIYTAAFMSRDCLKRSAPHFSIHTRIHTPVTETTV